jgi:hypothetical protein
LSVRGVTREDTIDLAAQSERSTAKQTLTLMRLKPGGQSKNQDVDRLPNALVLIVARKDITEEVVNL